jgi:hypothetical protein
MGKQSSISYGYLFMLIILTELQGKDKLTADMYDNTKALKVKVQA